jgi:hypothetical protein
MEEKRVKKEKEEEKDSNEEKEKISSRCRGSERDKLLTSFRALLRVRAIGQVQRAFAPPTSRTRSEVEGLA